MQRRQITLEDGRYLIFYTFDEKASSPSSPVSAERTGDELTLARGEEPDAEPQATEEQGRV